MGWLWDGYSVHGRARQRNEPHVMTHHSWWKDIRTDGNSGPLEVTDTGEVKPGLYAPRGKRAGCAKHPPVGLKISAARENHARASDWLHDQPVRSVSEGISNGDRCFQFDLQPGLVTYACSLSNNASSRLLAFLLPEEH